MLSMIDDNDGGKKISESLFNFDKIWPWISFKNIISHFKSNVS